MLRRGLVHVLLAFALLLAQQGAAWHAVSHLASDPASSQHDKKPLHSSDQCEKCIVFAQMGAAAASTPAQDLPQFKAVAPQADAPPAYRSQFVLLYHSRAPPVLA